MKACRLCQDWFQPCTCRILINVLRSKLPLACAAVGGGKVRGSCIRLLLLLNQLRWYKARCACVLEVQQSPAAAAPLAGPRLQGGSLQSNSLRCHPGACALRRSCPVMASTAAQRPASAQSDTDCLQCLRSGLWLLPVPHHYFVAGPCIHKMHSLQGRAASSSPPAS